MEESLPNFVKIFGNIYLVFKHFNIFFHNTLGDTQHQNSRKPIEEFADYATTGTINMYTDFQPDILGLKSDETGFGFNLNRCLYYECFQRYGKAERLGSTMCDFDKILGDVISPWIEFNHNSTIARGGNCCKFRYCTKGNDPSKLDW